MPFARPGRPAMALLVVVLVSCANTASGQQVTLVNDPLKGLKAVSVSALNNTSPGGTDTATQSDVESRLRAAGVQVLAPNQQAPTGAALLYIETILDGSAAGINVTLNEGGVLLRDFSPTAPVRVAWVTVWQRHRTVQAADSAREAIARLEADPYLGPSLQGYRQSGYLDPVMRSLLPTIMELEVKSAQRPNPNKIQEYTRSFIDEFVSEWFASNPKSR
jgi:hypothetical protein